MLTASFHVFIVFESWFRSGVVIYAHEEEKKVLCSCLAGALTIIEVGCFAEWCPLVGEREHVRAVHYLI